jgi:hypothetical protein
MGQLPRLKPIFQLLKDVPMVGGFSQIAQFVGIIFPLGPFDHPAMTLVL